MEDIKISSERYVYFDENGNIIKILNYKELDETSIKVEFSKVKDIISGKKSFFDFIVVYDSVQLSYILSEKITNNNFAFNASDYIYEIPKLSKFDNADITVIQDLKEKKWKFKFNTLLKDQLMLQQISINTPMIISITKPGNPHVLYRMLKVSFDEILYDNLDFSVDFQYDIEMSVDLSIYTIKKLNSYKHEVIDG